MKFKNKELCLLIWDDKNSKYNKFELHQSLQQNTDGEFHVIKGIKIGEV